MLPAATHSPKNRKIVLKLKANQIEKALLDQGKIKVIHGRNLLKVSVLASNLHC